jgi:hypothetical protein
MFVLLRFLDEPESQDLIKAAAGIARAKPADDFYNSMGGLQLLGRARGGCPVSPCSVCVYGALARHE